ncbi:RusA family crossover junction endodeoxyribonuclease [uncultured Vibrio sp.]|uniref:RusA family crossover junction endodeoxyribonuclease n=1 Tax=uncultured Vibrio sp. TaxID=114054 RepID=UPI0026373148|nr:RusA family crossover junction endodeoxyribonuclease [uncultured Vibrio sp.]
MNIHCIKSCIECRLKKVYVPTYGSHIFFHIPMPKSWSQKKRERMDDKPHKQRPDKNNLGKALLDTIYSEDCMVWDSRVTKLWAFVGKIEVV